jgi:hypothetical protein
MQKYKIDLYLADRLIEKVGKKWGGGSEKDCFTFIFIG